MNKAQPARRDVSGKLTARVKIGYGSGQLAEGIKNSAFDLFAFFYYSQVLGLSATLTGIALFIAVCVDAVTDPVMGVISDNYHSRWGRRHPFMYAAALPLAISFFFFFQPPAGLSGIPLFLWLTILAVMVRASMTLYHVPHLAQGAELSDDYHERTALVASRTLFSAMGRFLVIFIGFGVFFKATEEFPKGQLNPHAYFNFAVVFALAMAVTIFYSAIGTHGAIHRLHQPARHKVSLKAHLSETVAALNAGSFKVLLISGLIVFVSVGISGTLHLHMTTYFWELPSDKILVATLGSGIGLIAGTVFARLTSRYFDKKAIYIGGSLSGGLFFSCMPVSRLIGIAPPNGSAALLILLTLFGFLASFCIAHVIVALGSMMADICDENELFSGKRQEGIYFGGLAFVGKSSSGLGGIVAGLGIDLINFPLGAEAGDIPTDVLTKLALLYGPGVSLWWIAATLVARKYSLTQARHQEILTTLQMRRESS